MSKLSSDRPGLKVKGPRFIAAAENDAHLKPQEPEGTMAPVLELSRIISPARFALESGQFQKDYIDVRHGLGKMFVPQ
ncbi:MAG: hypothetical protein ACRD43_02755 [Pyrinomonadaceae bacterium]